jgi:pyruvate formate lyase activating enzyme
MIRPYLDAANVDLKFFSDDKYQKVCGARLEPVLGSIRLMQELGLWVEVTTLVVPEENDSAEELCAIAGFISKLDQDMPWHVSQFHPDYKFSDYSATPESTLKKALKIGKDSGLKYIYAGNVIGWGNDTICPNCKKILIKREVFSILSNEIKKGKCIYCGLTIPGLY